MKATAFAITWSCVINPAVKVALPADTELGFFLFAKLLKIYIAVASKDIGDVIVEKLLNIIKGKAIAINRVLAAIDLLPSFL